MTSSETTLDWIDAALDAGAPTTSDPFGREVQELALALRAESPVPDAAFAEELDACVEAGFPRRARLPRPRVLALGGGLAAAAAAAVVAIVVATGQQPAQKTVARQPAPGILHETPPKPSAPLPPGAYGAERGGPTFTQPPSLYDKRALGNQLLRAPLTSGAGATHRRVQRSANVTLATPDDRLQQVADGVAAVTTRHHGFVQHEGVTAGGPDAGGSLELRVPVGELDATLRDLSGLGHVRGRTETADDLTRQYATASDKLARARRQRSNLVRRIAHASSTAEADQLRSVLSSVDFRIRRLTSSLRTLNRETNFADVQVTLQVDRHGAATGSSTRRALHDALGILVGSIDVAIRALGVLIPLGLVAAGLAMALRTLRRRRREAVLT